MRKSSSRRQKLICANIPAFFVFLIVDAAVTIYVYFERHDIIGTALFFIIAILILRFDKSGLRDYLYPLKVKDRKYVGKGYDDSVTYLYSTLGYYALLISIFIPIARIVSSGLMVLFPCLAVIRYFWKKDILFGSPNKARFSATADCLFLSGAILTVFSIYNQQYTSALWKDIAIAVAFWSALFFIFTREYLKKWTVALGFIFCITLFSFGAVSNINRDYDFSAPQVYKVTVLNKNISGGRTRIETVTVTPWEEGQSKTEIQVGLQTYTQTTVGEIGYVIQHKGALNVPWYYFQATLG